MIAAIGYLAIGLINLVAVVVFGTGSRPSSTPGCSASGSRSSA